MIDSVSEQAGVGGNPRARRSAHRAESTDRLPPHSPEAEQGVIGCILLAPEDCLDELDESGVQPEWFYDLRHQHLFRVLRAMHFRTPRVPVDIITLQTELKQIGLLEDIGGLPYLNQLQDGVSSPANLPSYVEIVRAKWQLRTIVRSCTELVSAVYSHEGPVETLIEEAQQEINKLSELHTRRSEQKIKSILRDRLLPKLEGHYTRGKAQMTGLITTGLEYLDKIYCGWGGEDNGNFHVIAARPNVGKTSLVTSIMLHAALDFEWVEEVSEVDARLAEAAGKEAIFNSHQNKWYLKRKGVPVGFSSLESTGTAIAKKMLFQRAKADLQRWRTGFAVEADFQPLVTASGQIAGPDNIIIDDTARDTITSIKAKWRRWHRQHGVRFFLLDYIQLIKTQRGKFRPDRVQEMEDICAELQALGKELNCPMCVLAQLNRDYEKEPNRLPRLSDLKNCGAIEQDADSVTLLYKPSPYKAFSKEYTSDYERFSDVMAQEFGDNWKKWDGRPERINALVEKNREGPKGDAQLLFLKSSCLFVDWRQWLKQRGYDKPAAGEESRYKHEGQRTIDPEDVPNANTDT